jgi:hypothetical protein
MPDEINILEDASGRAFERLRQQQPAPTVTVYLTRLGEVILVRQRTEGEEGLSDLVDVLRPGGTFLDRPYEFWVSLGTGRHEVLAEQPGIGGPDHD